MKTKIINNQTDLKIDKKNIIKLVNIILKNENINTDEVIINFTDEKTIKNLHLRFFNDSTITDCISFPIDLPQTNTDYHILGEVFICTKQAIRCGKKYKNTSYEELFLYIIHSILHLIGYDDINKKDKTIMRKKEIFYFSLGKEKKII